MHIVVYFPSNQLAIDQLSSMWLFKKMGHNVTLITLQKKGDLHQRASSLGVNIISDFNIKHKNPIQYYLTLARKLNKTCREIDADIVIAHLQACMTSGIIAQKIGGIRCIGYRHYSDNAYLSMNKKEIILDRMINPLFDKIIVPSKKVRDHMITKENVEPYKLRLIPYGYNFTVYPQKDESNVDSIKNRVSNADLIVCTIARLVPLKRHAILIRAISELKRKGINIHAFFVGNGPEDIALKNLTEELSIENQIHFEGFQTKVFDYLFACDLMVLLSNTEASNNAVKEAAYTKTPVMICNDVGDFDDYTTHQKNAFVVNKFNPQMEVEKYLQYIVEGKFNLETMGESLWYEVKEMFEITKQREDYKKLFESFE